MLILGGEDVRRSLPMGDAIEVMKLAFASLARGEVDLPPRAHLQARRDEGVTLVMPARVEGASNALAVKVVSVFDRNREAGIPRIRSAVLVLDPDTGEPLALLEGSALTAIRTAAASGAATDILARPDSRTLAVLGAGVQARSHIEAMCAIRPLEAIRVFSPDPADVDALIAEFVTGPVPAARMTRADSPAEAVSGADIVCTTTTSPIPVFADTDLKPGVHINAVGSFTAGAREVGGATVARSWVVVDDREAAWSEAGDLIQARDEGLIDEDHVRATLGELVIDHGLRPPGQDHITLFKSVGVAVQDAVAAAATMAGAEAEGLGTKVAW